MKAIQPVNIWVKGTVKNANLLSLYVVNDDLKNSCTFHYALYKETETAQEASEPDGELVVSKQQEQLVEGNIEMTGEEYAAWNTEEEINDAAYTWAAGKLSLTLV